MEFFRSDEEFAPSAEKAFSKCPLKCLESAIDGSEHACTDRRHCVQPNSTKLSDTKNNNTAHLWIYCDWIIKLKLVCWRRCDRLRFVLFAVDAVLLDRAARCGTRSCTVMPKRSETVPIRMEIQSAGISSLPSGGIDNGKGHWPCRCVGARVLARCLSALALWIADRAI